MREMKVLYDDVAVMAWRGRRYICPNAGFVEQLTCGHTVNDIHLRTELSEEVGLEEFRHEVRTRWDAIERRAGQRTLS